MPDQTLLDALRVCHGAVDHKLAKFENRHELVGHCALELSSLALQKSVLREVEHLLTEKLEDMERVLAFCLAFLRRVADVRNKRVPAGHPLLLDNAHKSGVELGEQMLILRLSANALSHQVDLLNDDGPYALLLLVRKYFPPRLNHTLITNKRKSCFSQIARINPKILTFTASSRIYSARNLEWAFLEFERIASTTVHASWFPLN